MGPERLKYNVKSGRLYLVIEPGHYRPCGGVDLSNIPDISIVIHDLEGKGGREYVPQ